MAGTLNPEGNRNRDIRGTRTLEPHLTANRTDSDAGEAEPADGVHVAGAPHRRGKTMTMRGCWLLEVDLRRYFDPVDRGHLRNSLRQRGVRRGFSRCTANPCT